MSGPSGQHLTLVPAEIQGNKNLQGSAFPLINNKIFYLKFLSYSLTGQLTDASNC